MELNILQNFLVIAQTGNISKAAQILHLSQPALSRQLQALESELGVTLVKRSSRQLNLTAAGSYLVQRAQEIIAMVKKTENDLSTTAIPSGDLYIGCGETQGVQYLAQAVKIMHERYPQIHIQLLSGSGDDLRYKMKTGLLDFALLLDPTQMTNFNFITIPYTDNWGLLLHSSHPLATKQVIRPQDVNSLPAIFPRQHYNFNQLENWLGHPISSQMIIGTYNLLFNAALLVQENVGVAYCLNNLIETMAIHDLVFRPLQPVLATKSNFVWLKDRPLSTAAECFLHIVKRVLA